jgi:hypothetical protein
MAAELLGVRLMVFGPWLSVPFQPFDSKTFLLATGRVLQLHFYRLAQVPGSVRWARCNDEAISAATWSLVKLAVGAVGMPKRLEALETAMQTLVNLEFKK